MLADKNAAVLDEAESCFTLKSDIEPGVGVGNLHCCAFANGTCAKEEGGKTGNNFCIVECADITYFSFVSLDFSVLDHFVELHTCGDTCKITALIDCGKSVVEVFEFSGL